MHGAEASAADGAPEFPGSRINLSWQRTGDTGSATLRHPAATPIKLGRFTLAYAAAVPGDVGLGMSGGQLAHTAPPVAGVVEGVGLH